MERAYRCIAIVVTLMMLLMMSTAGVVFAAGSAAGPGPGAGSSGGGGASGGGASGSGGDSGGGGGDGAGAGGGVGAVGGGGSGGAKTSKFLTPEQEFTLDIFNSCASSYAGAKIDGLVPDGGFSFSTRYRSDANGIKDCMVKQGFTFSR
jgi:hypothetical protein